MAKAFLNNGVSLGGGDDEAGFYRNAGTQPCYKITQENTENKRQGRLSAQLPTPENAAALLPPRIAL